MLNDKKEIKKRIYILTKIYSFRQKRLKLQRGRSFTSNVNNLNCLHMRKL